MAISASPFNNLFAAPMDPPADMEQNSNKPSKTGQSSPTLTEAQVSQLDKSVR
jgi:hypothetical protein